MTTETDRRGTTAVLFAADETARAHGCGFGGTNPDHTPGCTRPVQWVVYPGQRFTCARHHIDALPTIASGQTGDLKYDDGRTRVWLERTTTADGEPYDRTATVETYHDGRWTVWERIDADNPGEHRTARAFVDVDTLDALRATGLVPVWTDAEERHADTIRQHARDYADGVAVLYGGDDADPETVAGELRCQSRELDSFRAQVDRDPTDEERDTWEAELLRIAERIEEPTDTLPSGARAVFRHAWGADSETSGHLEAHSGETVTVLDQSNHDGQGSRADREQSGQHVIYRVRFPDGTEDEAYEYELEGVTT